MESKSRLIILVIAGIVVAFAAIAIRNRMSNDVAPAIVEKDAVSNRVLVARRELAPGTFVQGGQDFDWSTLAPDEIKESFLRDGVVKIEDFNGAVVRRQLRTGEPITQSSLTRSGEGGFMSAVLEPGMRAVSVAVTATSGNAGFIWPGDRVDLIVVHHVRGKDSGSESVVSETFVRDVRVVAVDQMLDNPENKAILAKTVTVEVTPRQAEQISVAGEMGKISLTLRSLGVAHVNKAPGEGDPVDPLTALYGNYTRDSDVSQLLGRDGASPRVKVIRGDQVESVDLY